MDKKTILNSIITIIIVVAAWAFLVNYNNKSSDYYNAPNEVPLGEIVSFKVNDQFTFADGLSITLKNINDSRCKEGVQCIWAGEIAGTFDLSGGKLVKGEQTRLGTITNKSASVEDYVLTLKNATPTTVDITVEYKK